jgi:hypothetical protein
MDPAMIPDRRVWLEHRAYGIWLREGRPDGRALLHWLEAERDLCEAEREAPCEDGTPCPEETKPAAAALARKPRPRTSRAAERRPAV